MLAPGQGIGGALAAHYDIPSVRLHRRSVSAWVTIAVLISAAGLARHALFTWDYPHYRPLMIAWTLAFAFAVTQWVLSWRDRPCTVTAREQARLDRLRVTVNVPVYNEAPELLDRCLYSIINGERVPARIDVIDDGSTVDYSAMERYWARAWPCGTEVRWVRQLNAGKKHAQAATFVSDPAADIFVTIDSDTCLDRRGLAEGLKPFAARSVMSVAGIELAFNSRVNWLTRTVSARSLFFQIVACGSQSSFGDIMVNRGAYALYRAPLIRRIVPAYLGETFLGHPIKLGDDAALTLFARGSGRAVQQPSAFALTMYPETLSHHLRQWLRWMRGSTIRNFWRIRYLPMRSYGWWFIVIGTHLFLASCTVPFLIAATWPESEPYTVAGIVAMLAWGYLTALRTMCVRRSDEDWRYRLGTLLALPSAMMWSMAVLRPIRFYGMATCLRQGWTTRNSGIEVSIAAEPEKVPA